MVITLHTILTKATTS